jgi:acetate kinase
MPQEERIKKGMIERIGEAGSRVRNHYQGMKMILEELRGFSAIGHRVVHGAEEFRRPTLINAKVIRKIRQCSRLAPLHNPANLAGILASRKMLGDITQVAVFDTAFHHSLAAHVYLYGLPYEYYKRFGIRKYGFHGTSHEYVAEEAAKRLKRPLKSLRLISCHLGNGCSIAAIKNGSSIDTSMGLTPLEGLVMGTRCGDLDPAVVLFLQNRLRLNTREVDNILNKKSGLKGISGISNDMRTLLSSAKKGNKRARLSIEIFIYRIKKYISSYIGILGGLDALIFTAGIGENQRGITDRITKGLFSHLKRKPRVLIIPTDEELMIARQCYKIVLNSKRKTI